MPNVALLPSQPLQSTIRNLRRSIGYPIHPTSAETLSPSTSHILLIRPTPCVALFAALVDPSLNLINTENKPYTLPCEKLAPDDVVLWAGEVNLSVRSIWCETGAALQGLRIWTLGALRPRGAGTAAPSTEVIRILVSRAGGVVTDESPDIVLVAPGLSRRSAKVRKLLADNVLCLGAGFVVDLLLRIDANPCEYVAFTEQKDLCGPVLNETAARSGRPLPISKALLERSENAGRLAIKCRVKPTNLRRSKRIRLTEELDEYNSDEAAPLGLKKSTESSPRKTKGPANTITPDAAPTNAAETATVSRLGSPTIMRRPTRTQQMASSEVLMPSKDAGNQVSRLCLDRVAGRKAASSTTTPQRLKSRRKSCRRATKPNHDVRNQNCCAPSSESMRSAEALTKTRSQLERRKRTMSSELLHTGLQEETISPLGRKPTNFNSQSQNLISPTTPAQNRPKRPRLESKITREPPLIHGNRHVLRSTVPSFSDADTIPKRHLYFPPSEVSCDMSPPTASISHRPRSTTGSIISGRVDGHSFSVDKGFSFLFTRLGEPSQADVDRLLLCIRTGGDNHNEHQRMKQEENSIMKCSEGIDDGSNLQGVESPFFEDEDDIFNGMNDLRRTERMMNDALDGRNEVEMSPSQRQAFRSQAVKHGVVDVFSMPIPRGRNILSNVICPEIAVLGRASEINTKEGHDVDDQVCQDSVNCLDWFLGAENLVGISRDTVCTPHKGLTVAQCRRLWSSLFESNALRQFATSKTSLDSEIRPLTGVCIRLLTSGLADDVKVMLSDALLMVRDDQVRAGSDSLQTVLSSCDLSELPFRHKALTAIWIALLETSKTNGDVRGAWEVLNGALIPRVDGILNRTRFKEIRKPDSLEKELSVVLQSALLGSYMFSTKLDFDLGDGTDVRDLDEFKFHPDDWSLICHCMDKLCDIASLPEFRNKAYCMSTSLLRIVSTTIGAKVWLVTDNVVASASRMVGNLSSLLGKNCFCIAPPMIVSQFRTFADHSNSEIRLSEMLTTMCDSLFLLGWLYTVHGQGNPMKRAMNVIRSASSFTRGKPGYPDSLSSSVNHHVGLLLTVADSLACSSKDGEYLLCKMLTSKCPRPNSIAEGFANRIGDVDVCWRATLQVISKRCEILLVRKLSVYVYTDWLSQNLAETLCLLRRSPDRRPSSMSEKEALRAQDSVFGNLAMLIISSLTQINNSMIAQLQQDCTSAERTREAIEKPAAQISTCMKVSGDLLSQLRSNPEESLSKNRHGLLCALLLLVESKLALIRYLLSPPVLTEADSMDLISDVQMSENALSFITDSTTEQVIISVVSGGQSIEDEVTLRNATKAASGMLAHLIELQSSRNGQGIHKNDDYYTTFLQRANMDVTISFEAGPQRGVTTQRASPEVEDRSNLVFWSEAARSSWLLNFLHRRGRIHVMCVSAALSLLANMTGDWDAKDCSAVIQLGKNCANFESLRYVFEPIMFEIRSLGKTDYPLARVEVVEKAIRLLVKHWPTAQVCSLLKLLESRLKHIIGSSSGIEPDAVILYSFSRAVSAQLGGFTHARFLHSPLGDIAQAIGRLANSARDHSKTFHLVQSRVLSALCMAKSDMETRVLVLRVVNAFPASDTLPGLWGAPLLPTDEVPEEWIRCAERHAQEWRGFVFSSIIEDPLFAGRNITYVIRRLAAAAKGDEAMRRLVQGVLVRGRSALDSFLRRDGRAWREWSALRDELSGA